MTTLLQSNASTLATQNVNLQEMIGAGNYGHVSSLIQERDLAGSQGRGAGSGYKVFEFPEWYTMEEAARAMEAEGYRPANVWDLLSYGTSSPDEQKKYPIMALNALVAVYDRRFHYYFVISLDARGDQRSQRTLETSYVNQPLEKSRIAHTHQLGVRI